MQHLSIMEVALLWFMRPQAESWVGRTQLLPAQAVDVEETDVVVDDILVVFVCLFVCFVVEVCMEEEFYLKTIE